MKKDISVVVLSLLSRRHVLILFLNLLTMKTKIVLVLMIFIILFESCTRSFTPYEAANHPRGRKCGIIK